MDIDSNGNYDVNKVNSYRAGVNQFLVNSVDDPSANTRVYCIHLLQIAPERIMRFKKHFMNFTSPSPTTAANLFEFLVQRFQASLQILNCTGILGVQSPFVVTPVPSLPPPSNSKTPVNPFLNATVNVTMDTGMMTTIGQMNPGDQEATQGEFPTSSTPSGSSSTSVLLGPVGITLLVLVALLLACVSCGVRPNSVHSCMQSATDACHKSRREASSSV